MATAKRSRTAPFGRNDASLLSRPLEYIQAEHLRHRELCLAAEELAEGATLDEPLARAMLAFLVSDMALHVIDEEEDLFPILRRRLKPEDEAERIIGLLSGEHAADEALANDIIQSLQQILKAGDADMPGALRNALLAFADRQRRHLTVENAIVLPLASRRLSKRDLDRIASRMAARRNITFREPNS
ncbi:MAG: hemerythrin domain-containing protein [Hyphomicrobiaceae bacterium]|nr:hemerythrin domain-containing protein [Hyphomicrobiaceae bacterium]